MRYKLLNQVSDQFLSPFLGVGKTTLIHKTCQGLQKAGIKVQGFYTEELREKGRRIGFDVVTLDGHRGQLARIIR